MTNPFLTPPQVPGPQSRSWGFGFAYGFQGPASSSMTPADIQPEDADAFDQGVLAGQNAAINGIPLSQTCVDLNAEGGVGPHLALEAPEGIMWIADIAEGVAGGIAGGVLFFINLSIALETFTDDPTKGSLRQPVLSRPRYRTWASISRCRCSSAAPSTQASPAARCSSPPSSPARMLRKQPLKASVAPTGSSSPGAPISLAAPTSLRIPTNEPLGGDPNSLLILRCGFYLRRRCQLGWKRVAEELQ